MNIERLKSLGIKAIESIKETVVELGRTIKDNTAVKFTVMAAVTMATAAYAGGSVQEAVQHFSAYDKLFSQTSDYALWASPAIAMYFAIGEYKKYDNPFEAVDQGFKEWLAGSVILLVPTMLTASLVAYLMSLNIDVETLKGIENITSRDLMALLKDSQQMATAEINLNPSELKEYLTYVQETNPEVYNSFERAATMTPEEIKALAQEAKQEAASKAIDATSKALQSVMSSSTNPKI